MDKELITLLKSMKDDPAIGGGFDASAAWQRVADRSGFEENTQPRRYTFREYLEYVVWHTTHVIVKPVAASFAVFLFAIAGWVSAANISANTLPGDQLYPLKLGIEQAQLSLAFSANQRAMLQVEFASNRLEEMVEVVATRSVDEPEVVRLAVERVKSEVSSIMDELVYQTGGNATELAKAVGRLDDTYQNSVSSSTTADLPQSIQDGVQELKEIIDNTEDQAVEVIITAHELTDDEETAHELRTAFEKELVRVQALVQDSESFAVAIELKQEGAYRRAFQVLKEIELDYLDSLEEVSEQVSE
ncbi:hypothetical protein CO174_03505 [Candidatus Uhrbacteria bacterium CG_4_9_14_3_um_filter_50_9]|uniref:DUF5667 domain-containing protein n=1 Tax=Candidatus Uhrbacteria bacterium CG_4_9_14_3_um_filter_50_9 TaxID=1975035 RepID=A0A2M7XBY1_9BACT|nr:MAG: hypothetical protein CO174_03505 [Candidatus Uhrbacteria bacterium CG_4_9_14_3_um_filter_50_9]